MSGIFLVAAKRTPFGAFGGSLKHLTATELGTIATQSALSSGNIDPSLVDHVYFGNVISSSNDAAYLARHVGLYSNIPQSTPALTINRLCGSGFETILQGANAIQLDQASIVVCGGTENMSQAPLQASGVPARFGPIPLGAGLQLEDALWSGLTDAYAKIPMGVTAENLAVKYDISRDECDAYAFQSQQLWKQAQDAGIFAHEMAPIDIKTKKGTKTLDTDEHPRPDTPLDKMAALKPVFKKDGGVVTAANASGICDGAGSIVLASEQACQEHNLQPLARLVSTAVTGCDPTIMGIGPVSAIDKAMKQAYGSTDLSNVDRIEINEAFASQVLACAKELKLDTTKYNIHGGAISLGHPLGASGSRIAAHLAHGFTVAPENKIHVGAACIGGGQGIAIVLERV